MREPRRDMAFVSLAGPISNLLMALFWGLIAKIGVMMQAGDHDWFGVPLVYMGGAGIMINVVLAVLNLIPLPPLDGGRLMASLLPPRIAYEYSKIEPYGFFILLLLIFTNVLSMVMGPPVFFLIEGIGSLFGLR
jgi:Zn-dependent protease